MNYRVHWEQWNCLEQFLAEICEGITHGGKKLANISHGKPCGSECEEDEEFQTSAFSVGVFYSENC